MDATKFADDSLDASLIERSSSIDKRGHGALCKRFVFLILPQHQHGTAVICFPAGKHGLVADV
jgi:hypothetical protein